jgi:hypothetical protein
MFQIIKTQTKLAIFTASLVVSLASFTVIATGFHSQATATTSAFAQIASPAQVVVAAQKLATARL